MAPGGPERCRAGPLHLARQFLGFHRRMAGATDGRSRRLDLPYVL
jgi:hypothetical protein